MIYGRGGPLLSRSRSRTKKGAAMGPACSTTTTSPHAIVDRILDRGGLLHLDGPLIRTSGLTIRPLVRHQLMSPESESATSRVGPVGQESGQLYDFGEPSMRGFTGKASSASFRSAATQGPPPLPRT